MIRLQIHLYDVFPHPTLSCISDNTKLIPPDIVGSRGGDVGTKQSSKSGLVFLTEICMELMIRGGPTER